MFHFHGDHLVDPQFPFGYSNSRVYHFEGHILNCIFVFAVMFIHTSYLSVYFVISGDG